MKRAIYLKKTDWREARERLRAACAQGFPLGPEAVGVPESLHRITSERVVARISSPAHDAAAMDGIAVCAEMTFGATPSEPVQLKLGSDCIIVDTGAPVEKSFDAVIKIEDVTILDTMVEVTASVPPGKDIRFAGEDFTAGDTVVPENHRIRPVDIGALLSCGILTVNVRKKPRVRIIPTGSEIVEPGENLKPGNIIDSNSFIASNLINQWGGEAHRGAIVRNEEDLLSRAIEEAAGSYDMVIVIAGSSAGSEDLTLPVLQGLGNVLVHGVDLMPGKPAILAHIGKVPVIGLPGYPVSAFVILDIYVRDMVAGALGFEPQKKRSIRALLSESLPSKLGMDEIVRVRLLSKNGTLHAVPLKRGAGMLRSLVEADGFIHIPKDEEGFNRGREVTVELFDQDF
jgi:putative molybdopterin biosynthesis protein